jgi:hypothetical protein
MIKFKSVWQEMQHTKVTKSNEIINDNIKTARHENRDNERMVVSGCHSERINFIPLCSEIITK